MANHKLSDLFPDASFGSPATDEEIAAAESAIRISLPSPLAALYRQANGFREPLGNAAYLLPLTGEGSLVTMTSFYHEELPTLNAAAPNFSNYIFFGSSSGDDVWAMHCLGPHGIIAYHHSMMDEFEELSGPIEDIFRADFAAYDEL